jgi:hypothetical protein
LEWQKIKIEHVEPLLEWVRVQFIQLGTVMPIASAKLNPAFSYGNLALDYVSLVPDRKTEAQVTDFVFVLKDLTLLY